MLIRDMARKVPSEMSAIRAMAGVRLGHAAGQSRIGLGNQVGDQDPGKQTGNEQREIQAPNLRPVRSAAYRA